MPISNEVNKPRSLRSHQIFENHFSQSIDTDLAGKAISEGLEYIKLRLNWSGTKIANVLHLPANTVNLWLKRHFVPINSFRLEPDIQAIIHLLAIHRSLEAMFDDPQHQIAWLTTFHPEINAIPEEVMGHSIDGLIYIRQYLDYVRGRGA